MMQRKREQLARSSNRNAGSTASGGSAASRASRRGGGGLASGLAGLRAEASALRGSSLPPAGASSSGSSRGGGGSNGSSGGAVPSDDGRSLEANSRNSLPFADWWTWCQSCRHGGHATHLAEWFDTHRECPVTDCTCKCSTLDDLQLRPREPAEFLADVLPAAPPQPPTASAAGGAAGGSGGLEGSATARDAVGSTNGSSRLHDRHDAVGGSTPHGNMLTSRGVQRVRATSMERHRVHSNASNESRGSDKSAGAAGGVAASSGIAVVANTSVRSLNGERRVRSGIPDAVSAAVVASTSGSGRQEPELQDALQASGFM